MDFGCVADHIGLPDVLWCRKCSSGLTDLCLNLRLWVAICCHLGPKTGEFGHLFSDMSSNCEGNCCL